MPRVLNKVIKHPNPTVSLACLVALLPLSPRLASLARHTSPSLLAKLSSKAFASFTAAHLPSRTVARAEAGPAALGGRFDTRNIEPTAGEADSELGDANSAVVESD